LLHSLKNLFKKSDEILDSENTDLHILCGLMIEAANIDGNIDQNEVNYISKILIETFHEKPKDVEIELTKCLKEINEHKSLHYFTSKINRLFSEEKKLLLLQILWEIILEDGQVHDYESNLIRRLSGLLYISDVQCGNLKKNALLKLKN
jgi:uncharacterized tellurite resistance protein B-like protein